jgi:hypothetical protein
MSRVIRPAATGGGAACVGASAPADTHPGTDSIGQRFLTALGSAAGLTGKSARIGDKPMFDLPRNQKNVILVFAVSFCAAICFALYTNIAWDDWFITYRASKNLALGNGLTYTVGERIHSFTSPIGALVPAFLSFVVFNTSDDLVLWIYRILSSAFLGLAAVLLLQFGRRFRLHPWALFSLIGLTISDAKILTHTIDGMETAFLVFFLALNLYALSLPQARRTTLLLGVAWSGLMWTRPDGFIYAIALCAGWLSFRPGYSADVRRLVILRSWCLSGLVVAVLYGPWLVWAHGYYGSFIPHTIVAKGHSMFTTALGGGFFSIATRFARSTISFLIGREDAFGAIFIPSYGLSFGGWPSPLIYCGRVFAWACAFLWVLPLFRPAVRAFSLAACLGQFYLVFGMEYPFPWYFPPVGVLSFCAFAFAVSEGLRHAADISTGSKGSLALAKITGGTTRAIAGAPVVVACVVSLATAIQLRAFENIIYRGNNKLIGEWLAEHASSPQETVFLEPLGYIGYYSNLKMYDYPGLSSDEVVAARKALPPRAFGDRKVFADLIPFLKPDWLVLRPDETSVIQKENPEILTHMYSAVQQFDVTRKVASVAYLPGRPWFFFDQKFTVFRRRTS